MSAKLPLIKKETLSTYDQAFTNAVTEIIKKPCSLFWKAVIDEFYCRI